MTKKMCDFLLIKMRFVKKTEKKREKFQIKDKASFFVELDPPPPMYMQDRLKIFNKVHCIGTYDIII